MSCSNADILLQSKHISNQISLFNRALGKRSHALQSKQVTTNVCRRCKGHTLWKMPGLFSGLVGHHA